MKTINEQLACSISCADNSHRCNLFCSVAAVSLEFANTFTQALVYAGRNEISLPTFCVDPQANICFCDHHVDVLICVCKMAK